MRFAMLAASSTALFLASASAGAAPLVPAPAATPVVVNSTGVEIQKIHHAPYHYCGWTHDRWGRPYYACWWDKRLRRRRW